MPPITAAVKPLRPAMKPSETCVGTRSAKSTPAAPASAEPSTKVKTITRSMSMPIIAAASRSYDVARIAFPVRVLLTRNQSTAMSTNAETMMMSRTSEIRTPPMWKPFRKRAPPDAENRS